MILQAQLIGYGIDFGIRNDVDIQNLHLEKIQRIHLGGFSTWAVSMAASMEHVWNICDQVN